MYSFFFFNNLFILNSSVRAIIDDTIPKDGPSIHLHNVVTCLQNLCKNVKKPICQFFDLFLFGYSSFESAKKLHNKSAYTYLFYVFVILSFDYI